MLVFWRGFWNSTEIYDSVLVKSWLQQVPACGHIVEVYRWRGIYQVLHLFFTTSSKEYCHNKAISSKWIRSRCSYCHCDTRAPSHLTHPQVAKIQHILNPRWHMTALSLMQLPQMSLTATHTFSQCILNVKSQHHSTVRLWRAQTQKGFGI